MNTIKTLSENSSKDHLIISHYLPKRIIGILGLLGGHRQPDQKQHLKNVLIVSNVYAHHEKLHPYSLKKLN